MDNSLYWEFLAQLNWHFQRNFYKLRVSLLINYNTAIVSRLMCNKESSASEFYELWGSFLIRWIEVLHSCQFTNIINCIIIINKKSEITFNFFFNVWDFAHSFKLYKIRKSTSFFSSTVVSKKLHTVITSNYSEIYCTTYYTSNYNIQYNILQVIKR